MKSFKTLAPGTSGYAMFAKIKAIYRQRKRVFYKNFDRQPLKLQKRTIPY